MPGAFNDGSAQRFGGRKQFDLDIEDNVDYALEKHGLRFGGRFEAGRYRSDESTNRLGTFQFADLAAYDAGLPTAKTWLRPGRTARPEPLVGVTTKGLNDQHALLNVPAGSPLQPGDLVGFGISHPCLTFDRWRLFFVVDDGYRVIGGARTFF